ncbi:hypothetical protein KL86DPRO_10998 [uncultured delta proteobacterium]|uniref:Uncharacterized protein n=1 Tax=uncultured delta proteobacterium TaxID=34034 RepID=A0A212J9R2_9DELT|nr:hypothetical protein KL86DPRO_10998 [uncultured delta proteobacterium]
MPWQTEFRLDGAATSAFLSPAAADFAFYSGHAPSDTFPPWKAVFKDMYFHNMKILLIKRVLLFFTTIRTVRLNRKAFWKKRISSGVSPKTKLM